MAGIKSEDAGVIFRVYGQHPGMSDTFIDAFFGDRKSAEVYRNFHGKRENLSLVEVQLRKVTEWNH